jgi:hypothetical protein
VSYDCYCDYDPADVYSPTIRTARKAHRCDECGGEVAPGEKYENTFGVWSGDASTWKTCAHCLELRTWVHNSVPCFCWAHGNMLEDARNTINDAYSRAGDEVTGLRFGYLRRLFPIEVRRRSSLRGSKL